MNEVEDTGAKSTVSSCSNCRLAMDESKARWNWTDDIEILMEIIADHLADDEMAGDAGSVGTVTTQSSAAHGTAP